MSNIVEAFPREGSRFKTKELFQWDAGQYIHINLQNLPASYTVEFSNSTRSDAVPVITTTDLVKVPSQFLESGEPVYSWIVIIDELSRTTEYSLMTPVTLRSKPTNTEPRPEEKSVIDQAIAALNSAVEKTEQDSIVAQAAAEVATEKSTEAQQYAESAEEAKNTAIEARDTAVDAKDITVSAKDETINAKQSAEAAASNADTSAENSANSAAQAATSAQESLSFSNISRNAADTAVAAKNATSTIKTEVEEIKNISVGIKNEVIEAKDETVTAKNITETKANEAAQSATSANQSSIDAAEAKRNAQAAQTAAEASAQSASQSALAAEQSKTSAQLAADSVAGAMSTLESTIAADLQAAKDSGMFDGKDGVDGKDGIDGYTPQKGVDYFDGRDGKDGADGYSPTAIVQKTGDTSTITITDKNGTTTATVLNGKDGAPGEDGQTGPAGKDGKDGVDGSPGADGTTFTPAVSAEGVISWTNNGGKTNPQPTNIKGPPGDDGTSPTVSVADIAGGHRVTVTDANGTRSFDVMDGDDYTLTAADKAEIAQQAAAEVDVPVQDVQVNGTSILDAQGVANVPFPSGNGSNGVAGVVKTNDFFGISINSDGVLHTSPANSNYIKAGTNTYAPLSVKRQHESTFYGLAKAAGADMASSSNPVGTYTDAAKVAIQKMLGIYEAPWELIREDTVTNATEADIDITVDGNGQAFELTDVLMVLIVPTHSEDTTIGDYGRIYLYNNTTEIRRLYLLNSVSKLVQANSVPQIAIGRLLNNNGLMGIDFYAWNANSNRTNLQIVSNSDLNGIATPFAINTNQINKIKIGKITGTLQYRLFGRRKWQ